MTNSIDLYRQCMSADNQQQTAGYQHLWTYLYRVAYTIVSDQSDAESLAQESAQKAIIKIHQQIETCRSATAFKSWSRTIASRLAIDELRARKRVFYDSDALLDMPIVDPAPRPEQQVTDTTFGGDVREMLKLAPISERSYRVIKGRYLDGVSDEEIASAESTLTNRDVRPYHIQVTRSKNISKLRKWELLSEFWQKHAV